MQSMQKNKWGIKEKTKVVRIPESYIPIVDKAIFTEKWRRERIMFTMKERVFTGN